MKNFLIIIFFGLLSYGCVSGNETKKLKKNKTTVEKKEGSISIVGGADITVTKEQ